MQHDSKYCLTDQSSLQAGFTPKQSLSKPYNAFFQSKNSLSTKYQYYTIHPHAIFIHPQTLFIDPRTIFIDPQTIFIHPQTLSIHPQTLFMKPQTLFMKPQTLFMKPQTLFMKPQTLFIDPQTLFIDPQTLFIHPQTFWMNDFIVLLRNNALRAGPGGFIFVRTLFPIRRKPFGINRALFTTPNMSMLQGKKVVDIN